MTFDNFPPSRRDALRDDAVRLRAILRGVRDPASGRMVEHEAIATPAMQRFWQSAVIKSDTSSDDAATKVAQVNINYVKPPISSPPTQAQVQYLADAIEKIAVALTR